MIFHDTRRVADQSATCRETWRVGECHVPDTRDTACHDKSCPGYVNRGMSKNFKGLILNGTDIFCRKIGIGVGYQGSGRCKVQIKSPA